MQHRVLDTSRGSIELLEIGDPSSPPLVFLHGALVDGEIWRATAEQLADRFSCLLPTLPLGGHRQAMVESADLSPRGVAGLVIEICDLLDLEAPVLVANDSGGAVAQIVAAQDGARIGGLVLTNCDAFEVFPPRAYRHMKWLSKVPGALWEMATAMRLFPVLGRLPGGFGPLSRKRIPSSDIRRWVTPASHERGVRRDTAKFFADVAPEVTLAAARGFARFHAPVLLAWGDADPFFTVDLAKRLEAAFPEAELRLLPGARTYAMLDEPEQLAREVRAFVERTADSGTPALRRVG